MYVAFFDDIEDLTSDAVIDEKKESMKIPNGNNNLVEELCDYNFQNYVKIFKLDSLEYEASIQKILFYISLLI